jgi:uncharacterized damage-inducible protein DinB
MTRSILADAFDHHVWATLKILDVCDGLTDDQLSSTVPGTYGTILDTVRHTVGADRGYLFVESGGKVTEIDDAGMSLAELRAAMDGAAASWQEILATNPDPDESLAYDRDDGSASFATWGVRLAQAIHHGTDHRSQVCTALTSIGIEPPEIDAWAWADEVGKHWVTEPAPAPAG